MLVNCTLNPESSMHPLHAGDGFSARAEDAILHGCLPVVIMDNVHSLFESITDWDQWSVRINEASMDHLPQILMSIPDDRVHRMQLKLWRIMHRWGIRV